MTRNEFSAIGYEAVERLVRLESAMIRGEVKLIGDAGHGIYAQHMLRQAVDSINMLRASAKED